MISSRRNGCDAGSHDLFRAVGVVKSAVAQFGAKIVTHRPQAPIGFEKEAVSKSRRNIGYGHCRLAGQSVQEQWNQAEVKNSFHKFRFWRVRAGTRRTCCQCRSKISREIFSRVAACRRRPREESIYFDFAASSSVLASWISSRRLAILSVLSSLHS